MLWCCRCDTLCDTAGSRRHHEAASPIVHMYAVGRTNPWSDYLPTLCRGALPHIVTYSPSGRHSSGWKSGLRKCAVLKCELWKTVRY